VGHKGAKRALRQKGGKRDENNGAKLSGVAVGESKRAARRSPFASEELESRKVCLERADPEDGAWMKIDRVRDRMARGCEFLCPPVLVRATLTTAT
jgi:hypothetical protein